MSSCANSRPPYKKSIIKVLLIMAGATFCFEILLMFLLQEIFNLSGVRAALINAGSLVIMLCPLAYIFLLHPLLVQVSERRRAEEELKKSQEELEKKVQERTGELSQANKLLQEEINEREKTEKILQRKHNIQSLLNAMLSISLKPYGLAEMLDYILEQLVSIPWLSLQGVGAIFLVEDKPDELVLTAHRKLDENFKKICTRVPFGRCLCGRAALTKEVIFADRIDKRHENRYENIPPHGHYSVPILSAGNTLGVLTLYLEEGHIYKEEEEIFLLSVANGLAGIIERKRAEEELRSSLMKIRKTMGAIIQAMTLTIEARDPYTAGHQRRVSNLARTIADEMLLSRDQIDGIRMAGTIHDLGKLSIPISILKKTEPLTEEEFNLIKTHTQVAYDILKTIDFPWPVAEIVLQHHERMDGSGYPNGLSGEQILIEARIVAVADVVEAMASQRPYRPALGIEKALREISENRGRLYDATVVDVCLALFREKGFHLD